MTWYGMIWSVDQGFGFTLNQQRTTFDYVSRIFVKGVLLMLIAFPIVLHWLQ